MAGINIYLSGAWPWCWVFKKKRGKLSEIRQRNESKIYIWYQLHVGSLLKNTSFIIQYSGGCQELVKLIERGGEVSQTLQISGYKMKFQGSNIPHDDYR